MSRNEQNKDYTVLISSAILDEDIVKARFYFDEALKNKCSINGEKIVSKIHRTRTKQIISKGSSTFIEISGAVPYFNLCKEYFDKMDNINYESAITAMLNKIFKDFYMYFREFRSIVCEYTKLLPLNIIETIPAIGYISKSSDSNALKLKRIKYLLSLGYDINTVDNEYNNALINLINKDANYSEVCDLIALGINVNYINPYDKTSALSCAVKKLPNVLKENQEYKLSKEPENYYKRNRKIVKLLSYLCDERVIDTWKLKDSFFDSVKPGYLQFFYDEVIEVLVKNGFTVDNQYIEESLDALKNNQSEYNVIERLSKLYTYFDNVVSGKNYSLQIDDSKIYSENEKIFELVKENIARTFITRADQIQGDSVEVGYDPITKDYVDVCALDSAQAAVLMEISKFVHYFTDQQIIELVDSYTFSDITTIYNGKVLLARAFENGKIQLAKELMERGISLVCYDNSGNDVTCNMFSKEIVDLSTSIKEQSLEDKSYKKVTCFVASDNN